MLMIAVWCFSDLIMSAWLTKTVRGTLFFIALLLIVNDDVVDSVCLVQLLVLRNQLSDMESVTSRYDACIMITFIVAQYSISA